MTVKTEFLCKCLVNGCKRKWYSETHDNICPRCVNNGEEIPEEKLDREEIETRQREGKFSDYKEKKPGYYGDNWIEIKERARERDNYECRICGISSDELMRKNERLCEYLQVHHIIPAKRFNSTEKANRSGNLITLCPKCQEKTPN